MTEPRRKRRGRWAARAHLIPPTALALAAGLAARAAEVQAQAPAKPRTPQPAAPARPSPPDEGAADPLAPTTKPPPPQGPQAGPAADAADPLAVLREVDRSWLYERARGVSIEDPARPPDGPAQRPGDREPARVRCKIAAWSPPAPLVGSRLECQALRALDRPEGPTWSRYLVFDAVGVREVDERAPTDRSRTGALTFPRTLDGRWRLDERGAGGRRAQVTVREEDARARPAGAPARAWLAQASRWPPADPARRGPDVQIARLVPGLGPVLLCASEGTARTYECLRLVDEPGPPPRPEPGPPPRPEPGPPPRPPQPARVAVASHQAHDPSSLTSRAVARKLEAAYAPAVLRCYQGALGKRPGLRGTLTLRLTVNAVGKVEGLAASGVDAGVAACVKAAAASWQFPIPISDFASPRTARFTLGLALTPPS